MTDEIRQLSFIEAIRTRPSMYVGSTELFGFINYFVCPISLLLAHNAKYISVAIDDQIHVKSDAIVKIEEVAGRVAPFEEIRGFGEGHTFEGTVLNALSSEFSVAVTSNGSTETLLYERGERKSRTTSASKGSDGTSLEFRPDDNIFTVLNVSSAIIESYFRRLSFLHGGVTFSLTVSGQTRRFYSGKGILDLFTAISAPYQIMHTPIHIRATRGKLSAEVVMAYHSWSDNHLWCFINNGRAVEGGSHEKAMRNAITRLTRRLEMPDHFSNGMIAVASIRYPDAVWEGCLKAKIRNPELVKLLSQLVLDESIKWLNAHLDVVDQIKQLQIFQFPEAWYS